MWWQYLRKDLLCLFFPHPPLPLLLLPLNHPLLLSLVLLLDVTAEHVGAGGRRLDLSAVRAGATVEDEGEDTDEGFKSDDDD